ncbi:Secretory component protein SHR3 [Erysiphe necator]|uniref:Putative secretory component protein n=1 Tax=Uncinula necator TaxID=52586 RepID=A0A0B1P3V7_UNCNE|nr:Secretory component protein SHR3 [Erysiphe necator]KHJ31626.1 putative secretory component protein [Erysiphe necator]
MPEISKNTSSSYESPRGHGGSGVRGVSSFATFMIISSVCFFLGMLFSALPYDYPLLWTSDVTPDAYYDQLEMHLRFIHASPPLISRMLHIVIGIGFFGLFIKLFKPSEANLLFDGASLVLYVVGVIVYISNIVKGLRIVTNGSYGADEIDSSLAFGRVDSLKVLAASNTILALMLVGILVLQAGQWYAERKDHDETARFEREEEMKVLATRGQRTLSVSHTTKSHSKKKQ